MGGSDEHGGILRLRRLGPRLELAVAVQAGAGTGNYGTVEMDAMGVRRLLSELHEALWDLERAQATGEAGPRP